ALRERRGAAEQSTENGQRLVDPVSLVDSVIGAVLARDEQYQERGCALAGAKGSGEIGHGGDLRFSFLRGSDFLPRKSIENATRPLIGECYLQELSRVRPGAECSYGYLRVNK